MGGGARAAGRFDTDVSFDAKVTGGITLCRQGSMIMGMARLPSAPRSAVSHERRRFGERRLAATHNRDQVRF